MSGSVLSCGVVRMKDIVQLNEKMHSSRPAPVPQRRSAGLWRPHWRIGTENQLDKLWDQAKPLFHSTQQLLSAAQQPGEIDLEMD